MSGIASIQVPDLQRWRWQRSHHKVLSEQEDLHREGHEGETTLEMQVLAEILTISQHWILGLSFRGKKNHLGNVELILLSSFSLLSA